MGRHWWTIGLRGLAAFAFGLAVVLMLPSATTASVVMLFTGIVTVTEAGSQF